MCSPGVTGVELVCRGGRTYRLEHMWFRLTHTPATATAAAVLRRQAVLASGREESLIMFS